MKEICDDLIYDTDTSTFLGEWEGPYGDRDGYLGEKREKYYKTKSGRYFCVSQRRPRGSLWGHYKWEDERITPFVESYAKRLKFEGKLRDDDLKLEEA